MNCRAEPFTTSERNRSLEFGKELRVAKDQSRIEKRRADGDVGLPVLQTLVDGARRVADLEAKIPEQIEHVLRDALAPRVCLYGNRKSRSMSEPGASRPRP